VLAPLAVLFLAGAFSSLPLAAAWPLRHHGYGGVLGDLGLGLFASLLAHVNADRSAAAAGLFCFAAGVLMLMSSLGLSRQELRLICQSNGGPDLRAVVGWCWKEICDLVHAQNERRSAPQAANLGREPPVLAFDARAQLLEAEPAELPSAE